MKASAVTSLCVCKWADQGARGGEAERERGSEVSSGVSREMDGWRVLTGR